MPKIKRSTMRVFEDAFDMHGGYVLDFSNRTFSEFFEDELQIDIDDPKYSQKGSSKAWRLRTFIQSESPPLVGNALRALWKYRELSPEYDREQTRSYEERFFVALGEIETVAGNRPPVVQQRRAWTPEEQAHRSLLEEFLDSESEDAITTEILLPLFRQLGFERITAAGHTDRALEYGKDVWMKFQLPTMHCLYFGLQVKKGKIDAAGKSGISNIAEIHSQLLMMLGHPVFDPENNRRHLVDHALIISGGRITKQARNWLGERLDASLRSQVLFMERDDILDLTLIHRVPLPSSLEYENATDGTF